ncbi:MAG TPA: hypothetical protein PLL58_02480, partial [Candidatus Syntrophosphaera sp.]|nr:hypothetical protein [Candidatus Syntrophosphaera sp.]
SFWPRIHHIKWFQTKHLSPPKSSRILLKPALLAWPWPLLATTLVIIIRCCDGMDSAQKG